MALAVDWVTSNLYWSSSQKPSLHVTSPRGSYTTLLLQGALKVTAAHLNSLLRASCFFCARQHLCGWIFSLFLFLMKSSPVSFLSGRCVRRPAPPVWATVLHGDHGGWW